MKTLYILIILLIIGACIKPNYVDCESYTQNKTDWIEQEIDTKIVSSVVIEKGIKVNIPKIQNELNRKYLKKHGIEIILKLVDSIDILEPVDRLNIMDYEKVGAITDHFTAYIVSPENLTTGAGISLGYNNIVMVGNHGAKERALTHEIGHNIGRLKHVTTCGNIMQLVTSHSYTYNFSQDQIKDIKGAVKRFDTQNTKQRNSFPE